jgi:hypothetical protein
MHRKVSPRFEIALSVAVVAIAVGVMWQVAREERRPLDVEEMKIDVADARSFAAEGELLAAQKVGASVTHNYAKVHADMWRQKTAELARKYASREPEAKLAQLHGDVRALADQLHAVANEASGSLARNETASPAAAQLHEIASRAEALTARLEREAD